MLEKEIQTLIQLFASERGHRLWRFNVGSFVTQDGRYITVGAPGMSDLIGYSRVLITPEMVGMTIAIFTACEVKGPRGRVTPEQQAFIDTVRKYGGRAGVARSVDDAGLIIAGVIT